MLKIATSHLRRIMLVSSLLAAAYASAGVEPAKTPEVVKTAVPRSQAAEPSYQVVAGLDGELFPVLANYASLRSPHERAWGTAAIRIANRTDSILRNRISVQVPGWSDQEIQIVEVPAGQTKTFFFAPTFTERLFANKEIVAATVAVSVQDLGGKTVYEGTAPLKLRSSDDMYWGPKFKFAQFIASWVTPHDPAVESILKRAKEFAPRRRLAGYEINKPTAIQERSTVVQLKAIYRAIQLQGVSYVKSSMTLGSHADVSERVRMPGESLAQQSANCIDGAVLYASIFENLGFDTQVVLVPGHAYVGVRVARGSDKLVYIETSVTGRSTFEQAMAAATNAMGRQDRAFVTRVDVQEARQNGIYPMPGHGRARPSVRDSALQLGSAKQHR